MHFRTAGILTLFSLTRTRVFFGALTQDSLEEEPTGATWNQTRHGCFQEIASLKLNAMSILKSFCVTTQSNQR